MVNDHIFNDIDNLASLLQGKIIIGNQETISVFGCVEQQKLGELSKDIMRLYLRKGYDIETTINYILDELECFHIPKSGACKALPRSVLLRHYNDTLNYLEKLKVELQLQEAEILKENHLLHRLGIQIEQCIDELQKCLGDGKALLLKRDGKNENMSTEIEQWWRRLEQKIYDLNVSYIVSQQTLSQVNLLKENNKKIVERIVEITTKTIPRWKNQMKTFITILDQEPPDQSLCDKLKDLSNIEMIDADIRNKLKNTIREELLL